MREISKFPRVFVNLPYSYEDLPHAPHAIQYPSISSWAGEDNAGPKRPYMYQKSVKEDGLRCYLGLTSEMHEDGDFKEEKDGLRPKPEEEIEDDDEKSRMKHHKRETGMVIDRYGRWVYPDDPDAS